MAPQPSFLQRFQLFGIAAMPARVKCKACREIGLLAQAPNQFRHAALRIELGWFSDPGNKLI
jgi:hypothetical protein